MVMAPGRSPWADIAKAEAQAGVTRGTYAPEGSLATRLAREITSQQYAGQEVPSIFEAGTIMGAGISPPSQAIQPPSAVGALGAVPAVAGALGVTLPAGLLAALGIGGAIYGGLQAMGLGEGEGLFGTDILGGDTQYRGGIPFGGPGLAEPPGEWVEKEWHVNYDWGRLQYYLVRMPSGRRKIALYNTRTKRWKVWAWRTPRLAVIGKNMPSHKQITRLRHNLRKHRADADTILRMTSPQYSQYKARKRHRH